MRLKDKVIFITGGGQGIGAATAKVCAKYGAKVFITSKTLENARKIADEIKESGGEATAYALDVTDLANIKAAVDVAVKTYGRIDGLFNNAGHGAAHTIVSTTPEEFDDVVNICMKGEYFVAAEVAKVMIPNKSGRIVNMSSITGIAAEYGSSLYCMCKAAINMMTKVMALELAEHNITAVAICPGHVDTDTLRGAFTALSGMEGKRPEELRQEWIDTVPMKRFASAEEVGEFVAFLFDERSAYMDGNSVLFSGGKILG